MKNKSLILVLAGAVVFGLIAAVSVSRYLSGAQAGNSMDVIVVAKVEIPLGAKIIAEQLSTVQMPRNAIPEGTFASTDKVIGRVTAARIAMREALTDSRLAPEGSMGGLSALIPEGYRAMTVKVDDEAGLGGFLMPGTIVDVLVVIDSPDGGGNQNPISKIVLQNIKVLASGSRMDEPEDKRGATSVKTVTLLVTPEQAEKLVLSSTEGRLRLALRNLVDQNDARTSGANKRTLLTGEKAQPLPDITAPKVQESPKLQRRRPIPPMMINVNDKVVPPPSPTPLPTPRVSLEVFEGGKKRTVNFP